MFDNGNFILGTGFVDNGHKLEVTGTLALRASASASAATQVPVFIADPSGTTRELVTRTPSQLLGDAGGVTGTGVSGQVAFWNGTSSQTGDNGLFWDNTNKRLGVGTNTPSQKVHIVGNVQLSNNAIIGGLGGETIRITKQSGGGNLSLIVNANTTASLALAVNNTTGITFSSAGGTGNGIYALQNTVFNFGKHGGGASNPSFAFLTDDLYIFGNSGNIGINTTTDAGFRLDVNGTARVQGVLTTTADAVVNGVNVGRGGGGIATNTSVGVGALNSNTTGGFNTANGRDALRQNTTGSRNTANGVSALQNNTIGTNNTAFGRDAARFAGTGTTAMTSVNNSIYLGYQTRGLNATGSTNEIVIGYNVVGLGSNTTVLGNTSTTFGRWFGSLLLGTTTNAASSILTMESTTQGFLPPRMTSTQRDAIASPATGLIVYDNTLNDPFYFNGTAWTMLQDSITLTTTGTSGPATLVGTTLNIPNYSTDLTGYVPYSGATQSVDLGELGLTAGFVGFDLTPTGTPSVPGTMFWSVDDETVDLVMDAAVTQKIGQETFYLVKNQTGAPIPKGTVVRADGTVGTSGRILIAPFLANGTFPSKFCIGVTSETIADGADGFVTAFGKIRQINTASFPNGTVLYASPTSAGGFTATAPQAPNNIVTVAIVINSSTNNGAIFVRPTFSSNINEDEGVKITSPVANEGLFYNGGYWVNKTIASALGYTPANAATTLTINGQTYDISANRTWSVGTVTSVDMSVPTGFGIAGNPITGAGTFALTFASGYSLPTNASQANWDTAYSNRIISLTTIGNSGAATLIANVLNIPEYQLQGNYITSLTGEATASGPGAAAVTLTNSAVTGKVLTGLTVAGSSIAATDSILTAFGKLQGQVNDLIGGLQYQGTWDASTNTPAITSGVGTDGHFYIVSVAGNTIIDGVGGWQVGDWIVFHSPAWQKVDNTESVISVNGFTGAVTLTTSNISEGTNLYFTDSRARSAISLTTSGNSGASTYNNGTGVLNVPQYSLAGLGGVPTTRTLTINGTAFDLSADRTWSVGTVTSIATTGPIQGGTITGTGTISITQAGSASDGFLSSTDWNTFNNKQGGISLTTTGNSGASTFISNVLNVPAYTLAGLGGVPTTRTLSINGVSFDLSENRSWSVGTLTGSGNANYVPKWDGSTSLTDSLLFDSGAGVGVGTASINASALFQMDSTTKGFLPPRMTAAQRGAISAPAQGLIVYQTDGVIGLYIYSNSVWRSLTMV
jgi:predicted heme/steroid binding protein